MTTAVEVILERYPYRFVQQGLLEINGEPDFRIQKFNEITRRYRDMYYLDSSIQLDYCIEDPEYVKWLDPDPEVAAYPNKGDSVSYEPAI
tara:strand:+ start:1514 stop:1783 length:270 start_codon:yes stop_codon:yes gene_type:complete